MPGRSVSRRLVVGLLGSGAVAAPLVARVLCPSAASAASDPELRSRSAELLAPLAVGARFGRWTIESIEADQGAVVVMVRASDGHTFGLEVLARDASALAARPPAVTERFAVFVKNGGDGWLPTPEEQGLAAMELAAIVRQTEASVDAAGILTHAERIEAHRTVLLEVFDGTDPTSRA